MSKRRFYTLPNEDIIDLDRVSYVSHHMLGERIWNPKTERYYHNGECNVIIDGAQYNLILVLGDPYFTITSVERTSYQYIVYEREIELLLERTAKAREEFVNAWMGINSSVTEETRLIHIEDREET